jgi:hypothetical protein
MAQAVAVGPAPVELKAPQAVTEVTAVRDLGMERTLLQMEPARAAAVDLQTIPPMAAAVVAAMVS